MTSPVDGAVTSNIDAPDFFSIVKAVSQSIATDPTVTKADVDIAPEDDEPPFARLRHQSETDTVHNLPEPSESDDNVRAGEDADDDENEENAADGGALQPTLSKAKDLWKFHFRPPDDDEPEDWWFASTAVPLLAATVGPLANVLSIAALVTSWREQLDPANPGIDDDATPYNDPKWCVDLNAVSLVCGFLGNLFLLFNFTRFVRYIFALPATIFLWFMASGILMGITIGMHLYTPPGDNDLYSQGYWHAVIAAVLYFLSAALLMVNMLGYFLGHYTQHFELTDEQRNLILQTMMFFIWLAGGAGVFVRVDGWSYVDALYFCDVTVLTVGFGDFYPTTDLGRGLVFPYSVGGIIMLGLMVSSINRFASELGHNKIVRGHVERRRAATMERSVTTSQEAERRLAVENAAINQSRMGLRPQISAPFNPEKRTIAFDDPGEVPKHLTDRSPPPSVLKRHKRHKILRAPLVPLRKTVTWASEQVTGPANKGLEQVTSKRGHRLLVLREEKDRFLAMRAIQYNTRQFKRYFALTMSVFAFGLLWCVGAVVFWQCEQEVQGMTYFQALYFCYVSLLTIGYGDLAPKSNAGKPFFIVWSLIAVPTMTILISDMGDTVVMAYKRGTFTLAAWTVLPKRGALREFLDSHPWIMSAYRKVQSFANERERKKRVERGFPVGPEEGGAGIVEEEEADNGEIPGEAPTLEQLATEEPDEHDLARRLAIAIRRTADHLREAHYRRYTYEEWAEYSRLIRFTDYPDDSGPSGDRSSNDSKSEEIDRGIVDWDWIGEDSPMMSDQPESEWVLDRLCESLDRYMRKQLPEHVRERHVAHAKEVIRSRQASITDGGTFGHFSFSPSPGPSIATPSSMRFGRRSSSGYAGRSGSYRRWSVVDGLKSPPPARSPGNRLRQANANRGPANEKTETRDSSPARNKHDRGHMSRSRSTQGRLRFGDGSMGQPLHEMQEPPESTESGKHVDAR